MKILITGASGFIGSRLRRALLAAGHTLVCTSRRGQPPTPEDASDRCRWVSADFASWAPVPWAEHLAGVDAVVNLAGAFRDTAATPMADVHRDGPIALFDACVAAGVRRVVQVSALGADDAAGTAFHATKRDADAHLLGLPLAATVVQPSLVFGPDGASARLFLAIAAAPVLALPAGGRQRVQPVHVDDLVEALAALLMLPSSGWRGRRVALVGPAPRSLRGVLRDLRAGLGLPPAPEVSVPAPLVGVAAAVADRLPGALFGRDAWRMLSRGNTADAVDTRRLLGRAPRPVADFVEPALAEPLRQRARLALAVPLLRVALAALWIWTAVVSFGLYPVEASLALLAQAGVPAALRPAALHGAAALDLLLGLATLAPLSPRAQRRLWAAQALLVVAYTAVITLRLPEHWLHPYGPVSKNLPILAALALLALLAPPSPARRTAGPSTAPERPAPWTTRP